MNVANFKKLVAGYVNRDAASFVVNGVDLLLEAINQAKLAAQREHDFFVMRSYGFIQTSQAGADFTTSVYPTPTITTALNVKRIRRVFTYATSGSVYIKNARYRLLSEEDWDQQLPVIDTTNLNIYSDTRLMVYLSGTNLYITNTSTLSWVYLTIFKILPDYVDADVGDFFTINGRDWLLLKSIQMLNFYLKEDQRVGISNSALQDRWNSLLTLDNSYNNYDGANALD